MRPSTLWFNLKQGIKNIKRNWMFSIASVLTMAACIFLFGIFYSIVTNVNQATHKMEKEIPITVFFDEGTSEEDIAKIGELIKARPEVERVDYESADEAWEKFSKEYFEGSEAAEGFKDDNPLVNSSNYQIYMNDIAKQGELVAYVESLDHVREVEQSQQAAETLASLSRLVSYASIVIIAVLLLISIFLISNTISVGISVRKEEIGIMKYIGATLSLIHICMAIATLLISTFAIKASGDTGMGGMTGAIAIGSVICIVAAIAGDTSQDLKTGYLLGATPKKQQIGELIGVVAAALAIGGVLYLLDAAYGYGGADVPAPQATLMKMIVEGIMGGNLPWTLVFIGVFLALGLEILHIPVMPFAIGLYLPIYLNATIMLGGVVRWAVGKRKNVDAKTKERQETDGTLYCAGMIAGEGLVGILLAILTLAKVNLALKGVNFGNIGGVILMLVMILFLLKFSIWKKKKA